MNGLALAGGGVRGAYQIGVYLALKKCHIKISGFYGTSIGSFNAAMLAAGKYSLLLKLWQNVNVGVILGFSDDFVAELNEEKLDIGLLKEGINNLKTIFNNKGIKIDNFKKLLNDLNVGDDLYKSKNDFGLVTIRFNDLKPLYLFKEDIPEDKLNEYILASCYLPIFKLEKIIDGNYYLDGGFYDNLPVNALLKRGFKKVYAVDLESIGIKRPYLDKKRVVEIKPSRNLGSIFNCSRDKINDNIKLGYYDTLKIVRKLDGYHYIFKVRSNWYYKWLLRKVDKNVLLDMQRFFKTKDNKKLVIKALEYIMVREDFSYYEVYNLFKVINSINVKKNYGVYKFIKQIKEN